MAHGLGPRSHVPAFPTSSRSLWTRGFTWLLIVVLVLLDVPVPGPRPTVPDAEAGAFTAFGPQDFIRRTGAPIQETRTFTVANPRLPYVLRLYNGGDQGQYCPVSSALITLNGQAIFTPNNFNPQVTLLEKAVVLTASNTVVVEVRGKPGCGITLTMSGDNTAPIAEAGPDQSGRVNTTVTLDGSGSSDADGDDLTYQWSFVSKPTGSTATLSSARAVQPTFRLDKSGDYVVQLVVHDGREASAPDMVTISSINSKPVAKAGSGQTGQVGNTIMLDGTGSSDVDGDVLTYQWRFIRKPATSVAVVNKATEVRPTFTLDATGTYVVELLVNDGLVNSNADTVTISTTNSKPMTKAGTDLSAPLGATVTLDGSGSTDVDGDRLTYLWALTSVPLGSIATLSDRAAVRPTFGIDKPGLYTVQLLVNDGQEDGEPDTVTVSTLNSKPTADAGADQHGAVNTTITLDGRASTDPDGDPITYEWNILTKPLGSTAALLTPTGVQPTFTLDRAGTYTIQLMVHDGTLDSTPDIVTVTTLNSRPVAEAGTDGEGLVGSTILLDGSNSHDVDGNVLSYFWSFVAVPAGSTVSLSNDTTARPTFTPDLPGLHVVQLIVNDGQLDSEPDTVTITTTIPPSQNTPPVANAGTEQATTVGDTVILDGSGSFDPDGDPISYQWTLTLAPEGSTATLAETTIATPAFVPDQEGSYVFQLVVSDGTAQSPPATVTITATAVPPENQPPTVNLQASPSAGPAPLSTTLTANATDPEGDPLTYDWTFGDGSTATGEAMQTHSYRVARTYVATVTVTDGQHTVTESIPVSVTPSPDLKTRVVGRTIDRGRNPVAGARIQCLASATTSTADGTFAATNVPTTRGAIQ